MDHKTYPVDRAWEASACTLPTAQRPLRRSEFYRLFTTGVRSVERPDRLRVRLELTPEAEAAARAADLLVRETGCCSFFTFTLTATGGRVSLDIAVPVRHIDVLDALAHRAAAAAGS
jgi:hypothetical protein